jgi:hypothetical protein
MYVDTPTEDDGKRYYRVYAFKGISRSEYSNIVTAEFSEVTGLEDEFEKGIHVFPNPVTHYLTIEFEQIKINDIVVCDLMGNTIMKNRCNQKTLVLDLKSEKTGFYILKISSQGKSAFFKFIKE